MKCGKIVCIGQNYAAHAKEIGFEPPKEPVIFLKPSSALIKNGEPILVPEVGRVDYEGELAVIIGKKGKRVDVGSALEIVSHVAVFNDVTARDIQSKARKIGHPWALSKGMDTFAPMSDPVPLSSAPDIHDLKLELKLNGQVKQSASTSEMIFSVEQLIEYITRYITLEPGDIIATGTPEGVGSIKHGDVIEITIEGVGKLSNPVKSA